MKTGYPIRDVAYATFQGILLFPVFPAITCAQAPDLFDFHTENNEDNCCDSGRRINIFPLFFSLRVIRRDVHKDFTGHFRPAFCEKEVANQRNTRF